MVLAGADVGFSADESAAGETAADDFKVFYRGGPFRNPYQELEDGTLRNIPDGAAVALVTLDGGEGFDTAGFEGSIDVAAVTGVDGGIDVTVGEETASLQGTDRIELSKGA